MSAEVTVKPEGKDLTQYSIADGDGFLQNAISEVSGDFISGNFSSPHLGRKSSPGGNSSEASSDVDIRRHYAGDACVYASYPESNGGSSDNDWNPYTTESDRDYTPRDNPDKKIQSVDFDYKESSRKLMTGDMASAATNKNCMDMDNTLDNERLNLSGGAINKNFRVSTTSFNSEFSDCVKPISGLSDSTYLSLPVRTSTDTSSEVTPTGTFYSLQPFSETNDSLRKSKSQLEGQERKLLLTDSDGKTPKLTRRRPDSYSDHELGSERSRMQSLGDTPKDTKADRHLISKSSFGYGETLSGELSQYSINPTPSGEKFENRHLQPRKLECLDSGERTRKGSFSSQDSDVLGRKVEHILSDTAHLENDRGRLSPGGNLQVNKANVCLPKTGLGEKVDSHAYKQISTQNLDYLQLQQDLQEIQSSLTNDVDKSTHSSDKEETVNNDRIPSPSGEPISSHQQLASLRYHTNDIHSAYRRSDTVNNMRSSKSELDRLKLNSDGEESRTTGTEDSSVSSTHDNEIRSEMHPLHLTEDSEDTIEQYPLSDYIEGDATSLADRVSRILGPEPPEQSASSLLKEIGKNEQRAKEIASRRNISGSINDPSLFGSSGKPSFDRLLTSTKLDSSHHPYEGFNAYSSAQTFLSSQLEKATDRTFNHSIEMRATYPVDLQCYPVYGARQKEVTSSEGYRNADLYDRRHTSGGDLKVSRTDRFQSDLDSRGQGLTSLHGNLSSKDRQREHYEADAPSSSGYQSKEVLQTPEEYTITKRREAQSFESLKSDYSSILDEKTRTGDIQSVANDRYKTGLLTSSSLSSGSLSSPSEYDARLSHRSVEFSCYRPYRPAGSRDVYYTESPGEDNSSATTIESTHTGSDDAQGPYFPSAALGSRKDEKKLSPGVYPSRKQTLGGNDEILSTIEEKSADGGDSAKLSSDSSIKSYDRKIKDNPDSILYGERWRQTEKLSAELNGSEQEISPSRKYEASCSAEFYHSPRERKDNPIERGAVVNQEMQMKRDIITQSYNPSTDLGLDRTERYGQDKIPSNLDRAKEMNRTAHYVQDKSTSQPTVKNSAVYYPDVDEIIRRYTGEKSMHASRNDHYSGIAGAHIDSNYGNGEKYAKPADISGKGRRERNTNHDDMDKGRRQVKKDFSSTESSQLLTDLNSIWNQFQELNQDDSGSSWNSSRMDSVTKLLKNPVQHLSRVPEENRLQDEHSPPRPSYDQKRRAFMEHTKRGASDEEANGSYIDVPNKIQDPSGGKLTSPARSNTLDYSSPEKSMNTDYMTESKTDMSGTLYSIVEDSQRDSLSLNSSPQASTVHINPESRRRHLIDPHMRKLKEKIKKQRDKLDKERWKEIRRMEKLKRLECLLDAKKKGKITNTALNEELDCISSTSTALSSNDSTLVSSEPNQSLEWQAKKRSTDLKILKSKRHDPYRVENARRFMVQKLLDESETLSEDDKQNLVNMRKGMIQNRSKKSSKVNQQVEPPFKTQKKQYERPIDDELAGLILPKHKNIQTSPRKSNMQDFGSTYPSPVKSPVSKRRGISKSIQTTPSLERQNRASSPSRDNTGVITMPPTSLEKTKHTTSPSYKIKHNHARPSKKVKPHPSPKSKPSSRSVQSSSQQMKFQDSHRQRIHQNEEKENLPNPKSKMFQPESNGESSDSRKELPLQTEEVSGIAWFVPLKDDSQPFRQPLRERQLETVRREAWAPESAGERQLRNKVTKAPRRDRLERGDSFPTRPGFVGVSIPAMESTIDSDYPLPLHKMTLQDAFLFHRRDVVSKSRERQKKIALASEERRLQAELQREREEIFNHRSTKHTPSTVVNHPLCDNLYRPVKRSFSKREMKDITNRLYNTLPEVMEKEFRKTLEEEQKINRIKAKRFNKKIQRHALRKARVWCDD